MNWLEELETLRKADMASGVHPIESKYRAVLFDAAPRLIAIARREERLRVAAQAVFDEISKYGSIGHEGSKLLEVMVDLREALKETN